MQKYLHVMSFKNFNESDSRFYKGFNSYNNDMIGCQLCYLPFSSSLHLQKSISQTDELSMRH